MPHAAAPLALAGSRLRSFRAATIWILLQEISECRQRLLRHDINEQMA